MSLPKMTEEQKAIVLGDPRPNSCEAIAKRKQRERSEASKDVERLAINVYVRRALKP